MSAIAYWLRTAAGWLVSALMSPGPTAGLVVVSALTGVAVMAAFKYTADRRALRRAKDAIQAALLGIVLFRHDTRVMFAEEWRLVRGALEYMVAGLRPLAAVIIPMVAIFAQLELYCGWQPIPVGESALVTVQVTDDGLGDLFQAELSGNAVEVETPALRIPATGEVCWRIRADQPGEHTLTLDLGGTRIEKSVVAGMEGRAVRLSPHRVRSGAAEMLFGSGEAPLPADANAQRIEVEYPHALVAVGPIRMHWIWATLILATIAALIVKPILRVEI
ncbi:MAG: hypothetical protein U9R79_18280 [Armatimonadota bacterium]|nr:hypothetical protein [Armatimonadota bacterium]